LEDQLGRIRRMQAELAIGPARAEALGAPLDDEGRDALGLLARIGARHDDGDPADAGVGDERFAPVQHEAAIAWLGPRAKGGGVLLTISNGNWWRSSNGAILSPSSSSANCMATSRISSCSGVSSKSMASRAVLAGLHV